MMKESDKEMITLARDNPSANVVFLFLIRNMDDNCAVVVSQSAMAELLEYSLSSIARAVTYLKNHKFVHTVKTGTSLVYHVNAHIVNVDGVAKGRAGKFSAAVIFSETELKLSGLYDVE